MNDRLKDDTYQSEQRRILLRAGSMHWAQWLVVSLAVVITVFAWYIAKEQLTRNNEAYFHDESDQIVTMIKERMKLYENALWAGVALIDTNGGDVELEEWRTYAASLNIDKTYPGINGIGVIHNIQPAQLSAYLEKERKRRPDFHLHPAHSETEYWPITYIEPALPNKQAVGLDMAFETNRYTAIKLARDTGTSQVTGPIILVQDSKKTPGFLLYAPFYKGGTKPESIEERRKHIVGVTYAPFIMHKLVQGVLTHETRLIDLKISDRGQALYDDASYEDAALRDDEPLHKEAVDVEMYGRHWVFETQSNLRFRSAVSNSQPYLVLFGGIAIDAMILALFVLLSRGNRAALAYADEMTRSLKIETRKLQASNVELDNFAYVASHDLKSPLRGIDQLATWIGEDLGDTLDSETQNHLRLMRSRVHRMEKLLDDLLAYSRVGRHDDQIATVNVRELVLDAFEMFEPSALIRIRAAEDLPVLHTRRAPLELIFHNLIDNAIKHHDQPQGVIDVSARPIANGYEFAVSDDGPGIPPQHQQRVFAMFQTLKPRDEVEGSGIGLALVKKAVEAMGGIVTLESDGKRGCTVRFTWPTTDQEEKTR
ncbi:MAG: CHASE domain-containing protein [Propionivibrio sp.]|nr:CHASE domain-containing protein [Propionivibrio sp.]